MLEKKGGVQRFEATPVSYAKQKTRQTAATELETHNKRALVAQLKLYFKKAR